ncbi:hypothetical protein GCM10007242_41200 [Pigmentiphaga litoralis]|uniref:hypothetical protein n=1 Tax=Pigmentiphaga litoralis TaxID=516702 RepID=UPI00167505D5|nr:hypothetical protein [Pigmentiphaga litoralis]GGX30353.1 hypothetical protein GCM10007242_41200 [Pigmentiphaga litoralis]
MITFIALFLLASVLALLVGLGLGRAAAHADRELADDALAQGRPDIAAIYLQGCAA